MTQSPPTPIVLDPTGSDSHKEDAELRAHGSAVLVDVLGVPATSITDPVLLKSLLRGREVSKDARAHWPDFQDAIQTWPLALWIAVENMFTAYGADHTRLRRMIAPAFSHRRITALESHIEGVVSGLLDTIEGLDDGRPVDLREHLAYPLPIQVIGHLLGVPAEQRTAFRTVVDGVFDTKLNQAEALANTQALYAALDDLIETKRATPGDDMTSLLISTRDEEGDGGRLSATELRDTLLLMISAGYETTVNVIDQAITMILSHPDQLADVRSGKLTWSDVVEETLRVEPAVKHLPMRFAVEDIELPDGRIIAKGEAILASYSAANRNPDWHGDTAGEFDAGRPSKDHLAFGHGVHFCLGAPLARLEVVTALRSLFARFPAIELAVPADQLKPGGSLISNGHSELPVLLGRSN
ncbi:MULTISPECIES: cytochrome P450 [unclassified Streptomyces]|uniref:cytochrome P450 family protein n=1 Tax=unclassified Streptomyces TaxID=2593676 RepID=UPI00278C4125|nr:MULTISPECIES: cytochrome P450 [unclassified Streptomyces]